MGEPRCAYCYSMAQVEAERGCSFFVHYWRRVFQRDDLLPHAVKLLLPAGAVSSQELPLVEFVSYSESLGH